MNWKELTIGKKITAGFGVVIVLLMILGSLSFVGVGGIVKNASEVIDGKALDGELAQKEVDHLNWIGEVNRLLTDDSVNKLNVQTDHTKCGFGKWLFGEGRKNAEALVPSLAPLFKEIEEPHKLLHESAIEIDKVYAAADTALPGFIADKLNDHLEWSAAIQEAILENKPEIKVQTDHRLCAFGKWLFSDHAEKVAASDPKLGSLLEQTKAPHEKLHESAKKIISSYRQVHIGLENALRKRLDDHRRWAANVSEAILKNETADVETDPEKCGFGKWLTSEETKKLMESDAGLNTILSQVVQPHNELHKSAIKINNYIRSGNHDAAISVYTNESEKHLELVAGLIEKAIQHEEELVRGREKAIHVFKTESLPELAQTKDLLKKFQAQAQANLDGQHKAAMIYAEKTAPSLHNVQELLGKIREEAKNNILTDQAMLDAAQGTKRNVAIIAAIAILAGIALAFVIARGIIHVLSRIADGLGEGAMQVASAANQVSSSSQAMAEGSSQQAASIEETSSSMEEMSSMTQKNAENAVQADRLMKESNQIVNTANSSMGQLIDSMEDITKASEETSKIIKTIDEIAFQTNLLALNAAVEAARAGEAGAGFAVVADEVRNLAMRAAEAAKDTAQLIEETVKKVNDGSSLVGSTNEAFTHVEESAVKVGDLIAEISEASKEQAEGITQVNNAIREMDTVVQQGAANAEESASAAEEMNAQAEQLKDYVGELLQMVTGKRDGKGNGAALEHKKVKMIPGRNKTVQSNSKRLSEGSREVRPDQVIPFDDDENEFVNF